MCLSSKVEKIRVNLGENRGEGGGKKKKKEGGGGGGGGGGGHT